VGSVTDMPTLPTHSCLALRLLAVATWTR